MDNKELSITTISIKLMPCQDIKMFKNIQQLYTILIDKLQTTSFIHILGESRVGKSYLAKECMSRYNDNEYFKLYLKAYKNYNPCYSPFSLGLMKSDALLDAGRDALVDVLSSSENTNIKLLSEVIEYGRSFRAKRFSQLNSTELSIINRINYYCNNKSLFIVADDFEKWDQSSKNLLYFFMTKEARTLIPFLNNSKIIIISEDIHTLYSIKELTPDIFSVEISNYNDCNCFVEELSSVKKNNNTSLLRSLFDISNGNLGLACDILTYLEDGYSNEHTESIWNKTEYKALIHNILDKRTYNLERKQPNFIQTIKAASVIGEIFNQLYLPDIIEENEFAINKILNTAQKQQFIDNYENNYYLFNFFNKIIYEYFDENFNDNKKEYHYRFAMALKNFKPDDYYMQFLHLRASGKIFECLEVLTIYLIRQEFMGYDIDDELRTYLQKNHAGLFENYVIIKNVINNYNRCCLHEARMQMEMVSPVSEIVLHERNYLMAFIIYDMGNEDDFEEAHEILLEIFDTLDTEYFDIWLRSSILLYVFYVNRLCNTQQAKLVEKRIMKEVAKRYKYNPDFEVIVQILNRNSGAIYSTEIALQKTEKSVSFFEKNRRKDPLSYLMSSTNYSGLLMVASDYKKGFQVSKTAVDFMRKNHIWVREYDKIINNYIINGFLSHTLNYMDALEIYEQLFKDIHLQNKVLLLNNYYYFKLLSGKTDGLFNDVYLLFQSDSVQKHNDYYIYLIGINLICIALVTDNYQDALLIYKRLNKMIPSICSREEYYITQRYTVFENIINNHTLTINSIEALESLFQTELSIIPYDYVKRPYILTDQQFWSAF